METLDVLLSEQFAEFSQRVANIAVSKKQLKADFKVIYDKFQADIKELDEAALEAQQEFEAWKHERESNATDD